jgi:hypothetical protein
MSLLEINYTNYMLHIAFPPFHYVASKSARLLLHADERRMNVAS